MAIVPKSAALTGHELSEIRALVERRSGILFEGVRERSFEERVRDHLAEKGMAHGSLLLRALRESNVEFESLLERLLTQETSFFRYPDVFDALEKRVLPELQAGKFWQSPRSLRIWSAGCATGEEPYSIAISVIRALANAEAWKVEILATDISRPALQHAQHGAYSRRKLQGLPAADIESYFSRTGSQYAVRPALRNLVSFAPLNLAEAVYPGRFDCIFCMNVLIYFSPERRGALIQRFHDYLEPGGYLFLGHAETANGLAVKFDTIVHRDARIHRKPVRAVSADSGAGTSAGRSTP